jgi:hypothetical protein
MASNTGRTVAKYFKFQMEDSGGTFRDIPVTSVNGVGLEYEEIDLTAIQDAVKGALAGQPDWTLEISGPFDTTAVTSASGDGAAADLSGSHTVLNDLPGGTTPLGFAMYFGIQQNWTDGEPVFGLASTSDNGMLCMSYTVDPTGPTYTATFRMNPGSAVPAWGTSIIS